MKQLHNFVTTTIFPEAMYILVWSNCKFHSIYLFHVIKLDDFDKSNCIWSLNNNGCNLYYIWLILYIFKSQCIQMLYINYHFTLRYTPFSWNVSSCCNTIPFNIDCLTRILPSTMYNTPYDTALYIMVCVVLYLYIKECCCTVNLQNNSAISGNYKLFFHNSVKQYIYKGEEETMCYTSINSQTYVGI